MPARMLPSRSIRKALPVLLLSLCCALYACAGRSKAPAPADPDREHSQGAPLHSSPVIVEQPIGDPAPARAHTASAQQAAAAPRAHAAPAQADPGYIILQPGETLSYIAALYAVAEKDLVAWNGLSSAQDVRAGQRLLIRPPGNVPRTARAAPPAPQAPQPQQAPQAQAPARTAAADGVVIVAEGESLSAIARRYNVSTAQLREWNGLTSDKLRAGQSLRVQPPQAKASGAIGASAARGRAAQTPDAPDADGMITVQAGQSLTGLAAKYKVSTADLRKWNTLKNDQLKTGQQLRVKAPTRVHTVKAGESLGRIAAKYKVSAQALMQKNKLTNADVLPVGKELIIP